MTTLDRTLADNVPPQNPLGGTDPNRAGGAAGPAPARGPALQTLMLPIALAVIVTYFTIISPGHVFLGARNLSMLAIELAITAMLALGMLLVILPGHIDLSVGSGVGFIGGVAAVLVFEGVDFTVPRLGLHIHTAVWPAWLAMSAATAAAVVIWWVMGSIIVRERVPAFIITLGGLLIFRGLQWLVIHSSTIPVVGGGEHNLYSLLTTFYVPPRVGLAGVGVVIAGLVVAAVRQETLRRSTGVRGDGTAFLRTFVGAQVLLLFVLICNGYQGVPLSALTLGVVALAIHLLTRHTPYGRYLYAIGGNEEAAVVSGVPVTRVVIGAFAIMGFLTALTGFLQTAYAGASTTTVGEQMELDAVAACVIGGVSLRGGRGTVGGVLLGSLIIATLLNGMTLMAYSPESKYVIRGVILAIAVWADVRLARR